MLFLYLDESGNYTYSKSGSEYLVYTSLVTTNPYSLYDKLCNLEKDLKSRSITLTNGCFHASVRSAEKITSSFGLDLPADSLNLYHYPGAKRRI
jgi:hypothetical protein